MKNYLMSGDTIAVNVPASVNSGDPVIIGELIGVAATDAASGQEATIYTRGVFNLLKEGALAVALGDVVYWDATNGVVTTNATNNTEIGLAVEAVAGSATQIAVKVG